MFNGGNIAHIFNPCLKLAMICREIDQVYIVSKRKKRKSTQAVKTTPHINKGKGVTLVPSIVKLLHRKKERKNQWGSGGLQAWPETGS